MEKKPITHITSGIYKGRKLELGVSDTLRPTKNQVLQAGVSMLGSRVNFAECRVLDICCGSGQWGLETLSRGAKHVEFVDTDCATAHRNLTALEVPTENYSIYKGSLQSFTPSEPADVVIADPPYDAGLVDVILNSSSWGVSGSIWILEIAKHQDIFHAKFELIKESKFGLSKLVLLKQTG